MPENPITPGLVAQTLRRNTTLPSNSKLVLYTLLSRMMSENKTSCWPSISTIARDTHLSISSVTRALAHVKKLKWIKIKKYLSGNVERNSYSWGPTAMVTQTIPRNPTHGHTDHRYGHTDHGGMVTQTIKREKGKEKVKEKTDGANAQEIFMNCNEIKLTPRPKKPTLRNAGIVFTQAKAEFTEAYVSPVPGNQVFKFKEMLKVPDALKCISHTVRHWEQFGGFLQERHGKISHPEIPSVGWLVHWREDASTFFEKEKDYQAKPQSEIDELVRWRMNESNCSYDIALDFVKQSGAL